MRYIVMLVMTLASTVVHASEFTQADFEDLKERLNLTRFLQDPKVAPMKEDIIQKAPQTGNRHFMLKSGIEVKVDVALSSDIQNLLWSPLKSKLLLDENGYKQIPLGHGTPLQILARKAYGEDCTEKFHKIGAISGVKRAILFKETVSILDGGYQINNINVAHDKYGSHHLWDLLGGESSILPDSMIIRPFKADEERYSLWFQKRNPIALDYLCENLIATFTILEVKFSERLKRVN